MQWVGLLVVAVVAASGAPHAPAALSCTASSNFTVVEHMQIMGDYNNTVESSLDACLAGCCADPLCAAVTVVVETFGTWCYKHNHTSNLASNNKTSVYDRIMPGSCTAWCGSHAECTDLSCHRCEFTNNTCQTPWACDHECKAEAECGGSCPHCGHVDPTSGKGKCSAAVGTCGGECGNSTDCTSGSCPRCDGGICKAPVDCQGVCRASKDCNHACPTCAAVNPATGEGHCSGTAGKCRGECRVSDDCNTVACPTCGDVDPVTGSGTCLPPPGTCEGSCKVQSDCVTDSCSRCNGTCTEGVGCGGECTNSRDCKQDNWGPSGCRNCKNIDPATKKGTCQGGGSCGDFCGNNNHCTSDTCPRCDLLHGRCEGGYACGCQCSTSTDCDQTGSCKECMGIKDGFGTCGNTTVANASQCVPPDPNQPNKKCSLAMDLVFLLDGSGSIGADDWVRIKHFTMMVGLNFTTGPAGSDFMRYSIIQFGSTSRIEMGLTSDNSTFQQTMSTLKQMVSSTNTGAGLQDVEWELDMHARPGAYKLVVIMTDGQWNTGPDPVPISAALRTNGSHIYTIAMGSFDMARIESLSSTPYSEYFFNVENADELPITLHKIINNICANNYKFHARRRPTEPVVPLHSERAVDPIIGLRP